MTQTVVWLTRHVVTDRQRADFPGWRILQVRYRAESVHKLWLEVVLESGTAPDIICATLPWDWQKFFVKHVTRMTDGRTAVVRALTDKENAMPTGRYIRYLYSYGKGLRYEGWLPPRVTMMKQDET